MLLLDRALKEEEQESMNDESRGGELPPFISLGDLKTYRDCIYSMADVHQQERKQSCCSIARLGVAEAQSGSDWIFLLDD